MDSLHSEMGKFILSFEARRDEHGRLAVYKLPPDDGGGTYEVAGINDRYHPKEAAELRSLIARGKHDQAELRAGEIMLDYTRVVVGWYPPGDLGVEFFLRDSAFNRGPKGAARIYQIAVGAEVDGEVGPRTKEKACKFNSERLIQRLRDAREYYERHYVGYRQRFWKGLENRWNKAAYIANVISEKSREQGDNPSIA